MGNKVQGKNILGSIKVSGTYYPIFCGKTLRLQRQWDEIETTNINSGSDRDYVARLGKGLFEITGVTILDSSENRIDIGNIMNYGAARAAREFRIMMTDDDGDVRYYTFSGIIIDASFDKVMPGYSTSYMVVRLCGGLTIGSTPPVGSTVTILSDYWDTVNGQSYISGASSGDWDGTSYTLSPSTDRLLQIDMEGTGFNLVTGTPTAGEREAYFNTSPVRVVFPSDIVFDGRQRVFVMWERTS